MPEFAIEYHAVNHYEQPFYEAILEYLIFPLQNETQHVIRRSYTLNPVCAAFYSNNVNGFRTLRCRLGAETEFFELHMEALIEKAPVNPFEYNPYQPDQEMAVLNAHEFRVDHYDYLKQSHFTRLPAEWFYPVLEPEEQVFDFCLRVNGFVFKCLDYDTRHASVHNTVEDVLSDHRGVCQDFAHLMLGILRANHIPCRYVTGYLNPGPGHKGSAAIHAWIEAYIPGNGWTGFDPTNNLLEDVHYIKIAHGVDLDECQTLKGVVRSKGNNRTEYEVHVRELEIQNLQQ